MPMVAWPMPRNNPSQRPTIVGTASSGAYGTVNKGQWTGPANTYAFAWYREADTILNATNSTYRYVSADRGSTLACTVKATNPYGSLAVASLSVVLA